MWFLFKKPSLKHQIGKTTSECLLPLCPIYLLQLKSGQILHLEALWTEEENKSPPFLPHPTPQCPTYPLEVFSVWDFLQWYRNIWLVWLEARKHLIFFFWFKNYVLLKKKKNSLWTFWHKRVCFVFWMLSNSVSRKKKIITFCQMGYHKWSLI